MADIPNTQYVTVKKDANGEPNFFVGGEIVSEYRGTRIYNCGGTVFSDFDAIQKELCPDVEEFHVGTFTETAEIGEVRSLSGVYGRNIWCRVKLKDKDVSPNWVSRGNTTAYFVTEFVWCCLFLCRSNESFRHTLINVSNEAPMVKTAEKDLKRLLQNTDLSKFAGKSVELNGYVITIKKIEQNVKPKENNTEQSPKKLEIAEHVKEEIVKKIEQNVKPKENNTEQSPKKLEIAEHVKEEIVKKVEPNTEPKASTSKKTLKKPEVTKSVKKAMENVKKIATAGTQKQK